MGKIIELELETVLEDVNGSDIADSLSTSQVRDLLENIDNDDRLEGLDGDDIYRALTSTVREEFLNECSESELKEALDCKLSDYGKSQDLSEIETSELINELDGRIVSNATMRQMALDNMSAVTVEDLLQIIELRGLSLAPTLTDTQLFISKADKTTKAVLLWDLLGCKEDAKAPTN